MVDIDNHDAGTVTFQTGLISASGPSATGLRVANCNGGTVNFNSQITLSTQANTAVDLSTNNNSGAINFNAAGNGLDITTTSGTGFLVTGGGTITVQGADNSITSTTGAALSVANTTIGANGLHFVSISSDGGGNPGIVLNNTGALGGLTITGDAGSTNNSSGGTIQNKTGAGISLTNTRNVVLDQMRIVNTDSSGINGAQVTNFTFTNGTIVDAGDAIFESAIGFNGVDVSPQSGNNINGTLTITGSTFTNAFYSGVDLQSDDGAVVNANISSNTFTNPGFSGVNFVGAGNAATAFNLDNATIANNTISSTGGAGIQIVIGNSNTSGPGAHAGLVTIDGLGRPLSDPSHVISITGNAISVDDTGTQAITVANSGGNPASRTQTNFIIQSNGTAGSPLLGSDLGTVVVVGNNGYCDMAGLVDNNFIDANHTPGAGGGGGNGIGGGNGGAGAGNAWTPRLNLVVTSNVITDVNGSDILLVGRGTSGEAYLKIANNNVATPNGVAQQSIRIDAGNTASADDEIYLNIFGNTCPGGGTNVCDGSNSAQFIGIRKQGNTSNINDFAIFDAAGGPTLNDPPSNANVRTFIDTLNPHGAAQPQIIAGNNFKRDTTLAPPLLAALGGVEPVHPASIPVLTQTDLDNLFAAALERWKHTGLTAKQIAAMRSLTFELADLPQVYLAEVSGNHIRIDRDAGGYGWFVDSTPMDDVEFGDRASGWRRYTDAEDAPAGRMDLLTALMHEMGHRVGLCDSYSSMTRESLMYGYLTKGERRLPFKAQARNAIATEFSETHYLSAEISGETVNVNIGTLPAGKSVTITFEVTINNPYLGPSEVSNQGVVSFDGSSVLTDDPSIGGTLDPTNTPIYTSDISIQDAQVTEPSSGSVNMIFTVTLSAPAPAGGASVDFTTVQESPAINHATAGSDYTTTSGTVNFTAGEQLKTILVPVLSDGNNSEQNETFLVVLSNPVNATITDGTATGTILVTNQSGALLISELRTSGPAGAGDDFVEIYNNSDSPHTVTSSDGSPGYGLFKMGAACGDTPVLIGIIPNGTIIPARGHYLFIGSAYSLGGYSAGDQTLSSDIESDRNVGIFSTASLFGISTTTRFDAVGFGANTGGACDLLREDTNLAALAGSVLEWSYQRDQCGKLAAPGALGICPTGGLLKDSNNNAQDFFFADTAGTNTSAGQHLGVPGPENLADPINRNSGFLAFLLDSTKSASVPPNRVRDLTPDPGNNSTFGTLSIRRRFVNNTGAPVTRLRFRIIDITTSPSPAGIADLRARTSGLIVVTNVSDPATCAASGAGPAPCTINVQGTTLETPPAQASGGAYNSTLAAGTVTLGAPLANGASINLQLLLGVQTTGSFSFFWNVEALP
jgi:hypothetical protein